MMDESQFKTYLVREFFWELAQHEPTPEFADVLPEMVEVLSFQGYDGARIYVGDKVYDIRLSWRKDVPPTIEAVD
jgi:hypothetical protein